MAIQSRPIRSSMLQRLKQSLFADRTTSVISVALIALILWTGWTFFSWAVLNAEIRPDPEACRQARGACWGVLAANGRLILLGRYPLDEEWRSILGSVTMLIAMGAAALPSLFGRKGFALFSFVLVLFVVLLNGGVAGLDRVGTDLWSGLPLTILLGVVACALGLPLGIALALARRSSMPVLRWLSTGYIEMVRGLPLITLLFFGAFVLPIVLPVRWQLDPMLRIAICVVVFASAYLAEAMRGGLQSVGRGYLEAAKALHMTWWQTLIHLVLPLALRVTIPSLISIFIGTVKDTSLVSIVNIYDLTGMLRLAQGNAVWRPFFAEMYMLVSAIYLIFGLSLASYGRYLERRYALK